MKQGYDYSMFDSFEINDPNGVFFATEEEVRVPLKKANIRDQKITIHFEKRYKAKEDKLRQKYGEIGELVFE